MKTKKEHIRRMSQTALKVMAFSTQSNHYYSSNSPLILVEFAINSPCIQGEFNQPVAIGRRRAVSCRPS